MVQLLLVHRRPGRLHQVAQWLLVEVVRGDIQSPVVVGETVEGSVLVCASDGNELAHFAALGLLQLVLRWEGGREGGKEGGRGEGWMDGWMEGGREGGEGDIKINPFPVCLKRCALYLE